MADELTLDFETEVFRVFTNELIRDMDDRGKKLALQKTAFEFLARVIKRTPVDKGRARAGWTSFLLAKGRPVDVGGTDTDPEAIRQGELLSFFEEDYGSRPFIILGNAVHYVVYLEFGSSGQAPAGMVRVTFREMAAEQVVTRAWLEQLQRAIAQANRTAQAKRRRILPG